MMIQRLIRLQGVQTRLLPSFLVVQQGRTGCMKRKLSHSDPPSRRINNNSTSNPNFVQKIVKQIQNDPFVKLSLSLCVLIIGGTLVVELYNKLKKSRVPTVLMAPPGFGHYFIKREAMILQIQDKLRKLRLQCKGRYPILYLTGPPGTGKTELVRQFCDHFSKSSDKWFGMRAVPSSVLYLDASTLSALELSLIEALHNLGLKQQIPAAKAMPILISELSSTQLPWLIVVDNLTEETKSHFEEVVVEPLSSSSDSSSHGAVLVSTRLQIKDSITVPSRLTLEHSLDLLDHVSDHNVSNGPLTLSLVKELDFQPMALALAAATIKIYDSFTNNQDTLSLYHELLKDRSVEATDRLGAALDLYVEAATVDPRLMHTLDLMGSFALDVPVPVSVIPVHLKQDIHGISEDMLSPPPLQSLLDKMKKPDSEGSYWNYFKSFVPFLHPQTPSDDDISALLANSEDQVSFLRQSPIFSFKHCCHGNFEFIKVHSVAVSELPQLFTKVTSLKLDQNHVKKRAEMFERSAWFKTWRTFNEKKCLDDFHRMLPGLSSPGVLTESQFRSHDFHPPSSGTVLLGHLDYTQYLHVVSHYHRVVSSLTSVLRSIKGEMGNCHLQKYVMPHLKEIRSYPLISKADELAADIGILIINVSDSAGGSSECLSKYEELVIKQKILLGGRNIEVARSLVDLADLHLSVNNPHSALVHLQSALEIYKQVPAHQSPEDLPLQVGHALASTSLAYGELGDKEKCKSFSEQALGSYQSIPSSGQISPQQRKLVASQLINVTHAYLHLGDLNVCKKYSELASTMIQGVYPQGHTETVRLFNISSIINALLGNREESTRLRVEASKMKTKLDSKNVCKI